MRSVIFCCIAWLSGCSVLDHSSLGQGPTLDPTRVYLQGSDTVDVRRRDVGDYACLTGPLMCRSRGLEFECRC